MKYHVSVEPRDNIFPWENITLLAVHQNMIFHDRSGQYLYNIAHCLQLYKGLNLTTKLRHSFKNLTENKPS